MSRLWLIPVLLCGACMNPGAGSGGGDGPAARPALPVGVTADQVYQLQRDPRIGPCSYYKVEGFEVLLSCP